MMCPHDNGSFRALSGSSLLILLSLFLLTLPALPAEAFKAKVYPSKIYQGDAFMVRVSGLKKKAEPSAVLNNKSLSFSSCGKGCFVAIGAVDLTASPGTYKIPLKVGRRKSMLRMRVLESRFETIHLTLPEEKVSPGTEDIERIKKEADLLNSLWLVDSGKLWEGSFVLPLDNPLSTSFGTKRIINKETVSLHRGLDMQGEEGEGIKASNTGRVVLTEEFFFGGKTVVVDHGQGIFTVYMHLSNFNVCPGDLVSKDDIIGFVGSSGRSSGPHLHFGVKVKGVSTNPVSITGLKL